MKNVVDVLATEYSCQHSQEEWALNLPPELHHILHNTQRNLSPSPHSGGNFAFASVQTAHCVRDGETSPPQAGRKSQKAQYDH